jgi:hypothetical protein
MFVCAVYGHRRERQGEEARTLQQQIYFAQCGDKIKVGISRDVASRLAQLRTGAGGPIQLIAAVDGDLKIEKALHNKLRQFHLDGEWYRDCAETRAAIQNSLNNFPKAMPSRKPKSGSNLLFAQVAKVIWPNKTAEHLAAIAGTDRRSGTRWLSGQYEPPGCVIAAIITAITKRD